MFQVLRGAPGPGPDRTAPRRAVSGWRKRQMICSMMLIVPELTLDVTMQSGFGTRERHHVGSILAGPENPVDFLGSGIVAAETLLVSAVK